MLAGVKRVAHFQFQVGGRGEGVLVGTARQPRSRSALATQVEGGQACGGDLAAASIAGTWRGHSQPGQS